MSATVAISGLQECSYCRRDLTRSCRISCAEEDCDKQLCVLCFSVGVRIEEHRPWHQYRVSTNLSFPVFSEDWTAHEELLLLDAIKQSGLGNWKDISEKVESKTDKRCAEHYWDLYTGRYGAQLPPEFYTQTGEKVPTSELVDAELLGGDAYEREKFQSKQGRPTGDTQKEGKQANVGKKQGGGAPGAPAERLAGADISGYMPLRGDFDHEHENDAEELLADMTFEDEEPEADVELKLQVIRVFNRKLDEREKRKDFVVSRGLLDYKRVLAAERKRPRDERDIISRLRPFARFHSAEQHAKLIDSIIATKRLKERIDQLMYYRSIGFLNISDGMQYEEEKKKMKEEERLRSRRASAPYLFNSQTVRRRSSSPVDVRPLAMLHAAVDQERIPVCLDPSLRSKSGVVQCASCLRSSGCARVRPRSSATINGRAAAL